MPGSWCGEQEPAAKMLLVPHLSKTAGAEATLLLGLNNLQ